MAMTTYWGLTERQRSELTIAQVEALTKVELMDKGVLPAGELVLEPEPAVPEATHLRYRIAFGHYDRLEIAFKTPEQAQAFLELGAEVVKRQFVPTGPDPLFVTPMPKTEIIAENFRTEEEVAAVRLDIERAYKIREDNQRRKSDHRNAVENEQKATADMWRDWRACGAKAVRLERVFDTYREYIGITDGDEMIAGTFLLKVFSRTEVGEAREWFGIDIELPPIVEPPDPPQEVNANGTEGAPAF